MKSFLNRRSFMSRVSGATLLGGATSLVTGCVTATGPYSGTTDSDPVDAVGYGRNSGFTDSDPTDAVGRGRGSAGGVTDADPTDAVGRGRGSRSGTVVGTVTGTGFFISANGHLVTNFHVVRDRPTVTVQRDGVTYPARIVASDPANDIAILKIDAPSTPLPVGNAREVRVGEDVIALGYPLATAQSQEMRASFGRINALSGVNSDNRLLQIDTPVQPGNSGGPLIGPDGRVIAVVTARLDDLMTLRATGALPQNVSFGMRIDYIAPILPAGITLSNAPLTGSTADRVEAARRSVVYITATGAEAAADAPQAAPAAPEATSPPAPPPAPPAPPAPTP